jgi:L-phenylalanine/L-methionine N-acetyltransferase
VNIVVRHAEPEDYRGLQRIYSGRRAVAGTLQLPLQSEEKLRKRLSEMPEGTHHLVACVDGEVVGELGLGVSTNLRTRHTGNIGMAVHDDWQGKGIGTALMEAALDLADNWLNLTRIELRVYTDNAAGAAFRSAKDSTPRSSRSPQNTPLTSGVPSSCRTTRNFRIL